MKAAECYLQSGKAAVNIKLMFEGDEESNSGAIAGFVAAHKERLKADIVSRRTSSRYVMAAWLICINQT